ncbi:hypothetical protein B0H15DRAFT_950352 [Mycena belliarum]|uniref:Uncharacterized protein n=1 Tax=Mycena belliarum TaxID=1033014 RepID=A0AAD6XNE7_9AGAR|nr:hypothetical protein B0H15DRAFT_950352 [Mycena belliae]
MGIWAPPRLTLAVVATQCCAVACDGAIVDVRKEAGGSIGVGQCNTPPRPPAPPPAARPPACRRVADAFCPCCPSPQTHPSTLPPLAASPHAHRNSASTLLPASAPLPQVRALAATPRPTLRLAPLRVLRPQPRPTRLVATQYTALPAAAHCRIHLATYGTSPHIHPLPRHRHPTRPLVASDAARRASSPPTPPTCAKTGADSATPRSPSPPRDPPRRARSAARESTGRSARAAPGRDVARPSAAGASHGPHVPAARHKALAHAITPLALSQRHWRARCADLHGRIPTSRHSRKSPRASPTQQQRLGRTLLRCRSPQVRSRTSAICASMPAMRDPDKPLVHRTRPPPLEMPDPGGARQNARFYKSRAPQFYESRAPQLSSARTRATSTNKCATSKLKRATSKQTRPDTRPPDVPALATRRPPARAPQDARLQPERAALQVARAAALECPDSRRRLSRATSKLKRAARHTPPDASALATRRPPARPRSPARRATFPHSQRARVTSGPMRRPTAAAASAQTNADPLMRLPDAAVSAPPPSRPAERGRLARLASMADARASASRARARLGVGLGWA